jgi:hypothetical protein
MTAGHLSDQLLAESKAEAVGAGRPQSWYRAFALLGQAAAEGSEVAAAQLQVLNVAAQDACAGRADIERLLVVPPVEKLSEQPRLRLVRGFATSSECDWLRRLGRLEPSRIFDPTTGNPQIDPRRSNQSAELSFDEIDIVTQVLRGRISAATRLPLPVFEAPQLMRYQPGEEFQPHFDYLEPALVKTQGQRIATFLLYLNDDYVGGETHFVRTNQYLRGAAGDALFWANVTEDNLPDGLTLHVGRAPEEGTKWVFSQWIRDRSPAP